jgi:RNA polymerase sigma-70 factor (ECF subfamily)
LPNENDQFEAVIRQHQAMVFRTLYRLIGSQEYLDDLAQEVFLRLYRGMQHFRGGASVSTYLYRVIVNVAQDEWKRRRRERGLDSLSDEESGWEDRLAIAGESAEDALQQKQVWSMVGHALAELSETERAVIVLYHQEECTYEQIALALDLPIGTVRTHLHRGRQKLKDKVRERMTPCVRTT